MEDAGLSFGWRSALLGLAVCQILLLAAAIALEPANARANRFLSAALVVLSGLIVPYVLGFAGAYDVWRGLTFAPFAISLALGPLLWSYAVALAGGAGPRRPWLHFLAPGLQVLYLCIAFMMPMDAKWAWYTGAHQRFVSPILDLAFLASLGSYTWAIGRVLARHRQRLAEVRSDDDLFAARWLSRVRTAVLFALTMQAAYWLWDGLVGGVDFFDQTALYAGLGTLGLYLGVAGWRQASLPNPAPDRWDAGTAELETRERAVPDWASLGQSLASRMRDEEWWREPSLSLPAVARRMGTNTGRASRIINLGLGVSFSTLVNSLRAEAVAKALKEAPRADVLRLALDYGFSSKASFNRAFRQKFGMAPSEYRKRVSDSDSFAGGA